MIVALEVAGLCCVFLFGYACGLARARGTELRRGRADAGAVTLEQLSKSLRDRLEVGRQTAPAAPGTAIGRSRVS